MMLRLRISILWFSFALLGLTASALTACEVASVTQVAETVDVSDVHIPTTASSITPDRQRVILLAPVGTTDRRIGTLETTLGELAASDGLMQETVTSLSPEQIVSNVRLVVVLPPDPGLEALAIAAADVQFLAVGLSGVVSGDNITIIGPEGFQPDQIGFLAGYIAAVITPDWRVGVITSGESVENLAANSGFIQGVRYFCGQCRPYYPPYLYYPLSTIVPDSESDWKAGVDILEDNAVETVFVYPSEASDNLITELMSRGIKVIGDQAIPDNFQGSLWVATIRSDPSSAVREVWEDLMAGRGGAVLPMPLEIVDVNPELLSDGRLNLAKKVLRDLLDGFVITGVDSVTGEVQ